MGRLKQFDEQEVLDKAMLSFWKNGYENTSVRQLERDMGINQFSIYATFKSKDELYKRVLDNYTQKLNDTFLSELKKPDADIRAVRSFLANFAFSIKDGKVPNSCIMVSSATRINQYDAPTQKMIIDFFKRMKKMFQKALENSVQAKLIAVDTDLNLESEYLVGIAQSISVYSQLKSKKEIKQYIQHAIDKIR